MIEFYPITMYNWDGRFIVCQSKAHMDALGKGWYKTASEATQAHLLAQQELTQAVQQMSPEIQRARRREN